MWWWWWWLRRWRWRWRKWRWRPVTCIAIDHSPFQPSACICRIATSCRKSCADDEPSSGGSAGAAGASAAAAGSASGGGPPPRASFGFFDSAGFEPAPPPKPPSESFGTPGGARTLGGDELAPASSSSATFGPKSDGTFTLFTSVLPPPRRVDSGGPKPSGGDDEPERPRCASGEREKSSRLSPSAPPEKRAERPPLPAAACSKSARVRGVCPRWSRPEPAPWPRARADSAPVCGPWRPGYAAWKVRCTSAISC